MSDADAGAKPAQPDGAKGPEAGAAASTDAEVLGTTTKDQGSGLTPAELERRQAGAPDEPGGPVAVGLRTGMFGATQGADTSGYGGLQRPVLVAGRAERPYGSYFDDVADSLEAALVGSTASFSEAVDHVVVDRGELTLHIRREHLVAVARGLRDDPALRFEICTGVSGVHYPDRIGEELHAVYHFLSITNNGRRVRVEVSCPDDDPHIPSIVSVYPANDWHERETWDMFGIQFDGHPALTRILMPDDWPGHPQRKDYPLGGIDVEYKGATVPPPDQRRSYS